MKVLYLLFAVLITLTSSFGFASDGAMLTVTGNISKTNQPNKRSFVFSFNDLSKLPNTIVRTQTVWSATSDFNGPMMQDILSAVGTNSDAKKVEIRCHDNFVVT